MRVWEAPDYRTGRKQIWQELRDQAQVMENSTDLFPTCMCYLGRSAVHLAGPEERTVNWRHAVGRYVPRGGST